MLILVVGPSGAGKDTVLSLARVALAEDPRFRFVRRVITRPADAGGEDHEAVTDSTFAERPFALQWQAHGLRYGIPADIVADLKRGIRVVANVSRGIIAEAAERFAARVIVITAPVDVLAQRRQNPSPDVPPRRGWDRRCRQCRGRAGRQSPRHVRAQSTLRPPDRSGSSCHPLLPSRTGDGPGAGIRPRCACARGGMARGSTGEGCNIRSITIMNRND